MERTFSALTLSVSNLRKTMLPSQVEKMIFLKFNQNFIPEVRDYNKAVDSRAAKAVKELVAVLDKAAGHEVATGI